MMRFRLRYFVLVFCVFVVAGFWYCFIHRIHQTRSKAGWYVDASFVLMGCPVCLGEIHQLSYRGKHISCPILEPNDEQTIFLQVATPVVVLDVYDGAHSWRFFQFERQYEEIGEEITPQDMEKGYYDLVVADGRYAKKRGTPEHWCQVSGGDSIRWLEPELFEKIDWNAFAQGRPTGK